MKIFAKIIVATLGLNMGLSNAVLAEQHHNHEQHSHHHHEHHHAHADEKHTEHKAHEHGAANMQLVMMEDEVLIQVESPLFNMLGFEHKAKNKQQQNMVTQQLELIEQAQLIELDNQAQCALESKKVQHPFENAHEAHGHHDHHHGDDETQHRDIDFEYHFHCKHPRNLKQINTAKLFKAWPNLHKLRVEWVYHNHQSAVELTQETPLLKFE